MFDSGIVEFYSVVNIAEQGKMPKMALSLKSKSFYEERTIGYNRRYASQGANEQIDLLIRIWADRSIKIGDVAIIDALQYRILNVAQMLNNSNLAVTEITLQRLNDDYDVDL